MSLHAFQTKINESAEFRERLNTIASPVELMTLAKEFEVELTTEELKTVAENAFQHWVAQLDDRTRHFFEQAQSQLEINKQLKQCQSVEEAIELAQTHGFELTRVDLEQAATVAATITGFSFEKLWFKQLGLLP